MAYYILDWDDTCADTAELKRRAFDLFTQLFHDPERVRDTYTRASEGGYTPDKHFTFLLKEMPKSSSEVYDLYQAYTDAIERLFQDCGRLMYPDAREFIEHHQDSLLVLTVGDPEFQTRKITEAKVGELATVVCEKNSKGEALRQWCLKQGIEPSHFPFIFVDDKLLNLEDVLQDFPYGRGIWMNRHETGDQPKLPEKIVRAASFAELKPERLEGFTAELNSGEVRHQPSSELFYARR